MNSSKLFYHRIPELVQREVCKSYLECTLQVTKFPLFLEHIGLVDRMSVSVMSH